MSNLLYMLNAFKSQSYRPFNQVLKGAFSFTYRHKHLLGATVKPAQQLKSRLSTSTHGLDANINLTKDVILYKYENPKFYNMLNIFALCQFIFWNYLSHFAFTTLKDAPVNPDPEAELKWYQRINLGENKYRNGIAILCFFIGYGILVAAWMFTLRSVRFLILRKGGRDVAIVTYGPFNKNRIMTVPLKDVSAQESRKAASTQLPLKVKNRSLFYILDMRGEFTNPELYDYTAGLNRRF